MTTENIIKLNQIIGKALVDVANKSYFERIEKMKSRPFDEVVDSIKSYKKTGYNKANGYFVTDAIRYLDKRLEEEYEEVWMEINEDADNDWLNAIEKFRW